MKPDICLIWMLAIIAAAIAHGGSRGRAAGRPHRVDAAANALGRNPFGELVKYGYALMVKSERLNVRRPM
jgi:hypothetical protein